MLSSGEHLADRLVSSLGGSGMKWQYQIINFRTIGSWLDTLNESGTYGWELVQIVAMPAELGGNIYAFLKRKVTE